MSLPPPRDPQGPYRVCFVCLGNICRSPMAEVVARAQLAKAGLADRVVVDSAGTGDWHLGDHMNSRARQALARRGYDGESHRARQYEASWLGDHDLVLAMDHSNFKNLKSLSRTDLSGSGEPGASPSGGIVPPGKPSASAAPASGKVAAYGKHGASAAPASGKVAAHGKHSGSSRIRLFGDVTGLNGADVPDPYGGSPAEFDRVLDLLESAMPKLIAQLARTLPPPARPSATG